MFKMVNEDDIIRKRLLYDGDGTGDDRRIQTLLKTVLKWCYTPEEDDDERKTTYQRILSLIKQCEYYMHKNYMVYKMNIAERNNYEALFDEIEKQIKEAKEEIGSCKIELQKAKQIRRNRQEYDTMAKVIEKKPDRKQSQKELDELEDELNDLKLRREELMRKLELREKQFHVLIHSTLMLQKILQEEKEETQIREQETAMDLG